MTKPKPKKCAHVDRDGRKCRAWAWNNSDWCWPHHPDNAGLIGAPR